MHHRAQSPQQHTRRHPSNHAILASQRRPSRLQRNEEREEERNSRIQVALVKPDVGREVCGLGIAYLHDCQCSSGFGGAQRTLLLSSELNRNSSARKGRSSVSSLISVRLCKRAVGASLSSSWCMVRAGRGADRRASSCCWLIAVECGAKTGQVERGITVTLSHDLPEHAG